MKNVEEYRECIKGKKILVVGMGKSGMASVKVLKKLGAIVAIQDTKTEDELEPSFGRYLENEGICEKYFRCIPSQITDFDMIVLSPGVPTDLDWIRNAALANVEVVGEFELAYRLSKAEYVAITGTNGKTTTTTLVGDIFYAAGRRTSVVGNIGKAVISQAIDSNEGDWMVAEASSFQLETTKLFRPLVSAILNLTPDHLNRHKTLEAYGEAKARINMNQTSDDYLVYNYDDKATIKLVEKCKARLVPFSRTKMLDYGAFVEDGKITIRDDESSYQLCGVDELKIIGNHNVENALAAAAISYFAGIDVETISETLRKFPGVEHRIEFSGTVDDVRYYNDSKGTNVDAAVTALKALKDNIILIAGGDGKGQDFTELTRAFEGHVKSLILLGRDAPIIEKNARDVGFDNIYNCKDMSACVAKARELAVSGDKVLLSPACASWDMYDNYEQRGNHFKSCVEDMLK